MNLEHVFVSFQDFVGKTRNFLFECWPDSAEKRDILITGNLDISGIGYGKFCSLMNCRKLDFRTVTYSWMGGIRRIEQANSGLTEL